MTSSRSLAHVTTHQPTLLRCVFDSGITLTIVFGLPYVASGQMTAGQLIDNFIKLNFHVNFCLREVHTF